MEDLCNNLERYLHDVLGIGVAVAPWEKEGRMPPFLRDRYRFFWAELLNLRCLFIVDGHEEEESPGAIRKHVERIRESWGDAVVYVRDRVTAYNRKRLIEHKVLFIVPGTQMYLPTLGLDLREHFRKPRQEKKELGPAAQAVLIYALLRDPGAPGPTALAAKLGYSVMAMSRALDDLDATGLGQTIASGRERRLHLAGSRREVWEKAQPLLRSPVVKRHDIRLEPNTVLPGPRTGLDALAHYSMLAEPGNVAVALSRENWKAMRHTDRVQTAIMDDPGSTTVEIWSYAPVLFSVEGWVDRLSLYLSLRTTEDERVQAALGQMIKEVSW
jgi:DNA-binding MarR family transcriptional regulator